MSMRIHKVMPKETKIKLAMIGTAVCALVLISIPYLVNVLNSHTSDPVAEIEIPNTKSPEVESTPTPTPEPASEPSPIPESTPAEAAPVANETPQVYYTYTITQPAVSEQPTATTPTPTPEPKNESSSQGNYIDSNEDDGYTPTGIDDPCIEDSACEQ